MCSTKNEKSCFKEIRVLTEQEDRKDSQVLWAHVCPPQNSEFEVPGPSTQYLEIRSLKRSLRFKEIHETVKVGP